MNTDTRLLRDVVEELQREPRLEGARIEVAALEGVVTLTGCVPAYAQVFTAEGAAKRVTGVRAVANQIAFEPVGGPRSGTEIAVAAADALRADAAVPSHRIQVTVRDGWIILEGGVDSPAEKEAADRAVRRLIGARGVTNSILVQPRTPPADRVGAGQKTGPSPEAEARGGAALCGQV
ncbi:MAG TPA: BON domain-containing protein [Gemmataceae bacterium]|nr:BON domain-containing protein [Gemmataceae bacterium]